MDGSKVVEILDMLGGEHADGCTMQYGGKRYPMPYHSFYIGDQKIEGLREIDNRVAMIRGEIEKYNVQKQHLIDLGCNMGSIANAIGQDFVDWYGYDIDQRQLSIAQKLYGNHFVHLNFEHHLDIIPDADVFLLLSVIEYIDKKEVFLQKLARKTRGICIIEGHSMDDKYNKTEMYDKMIRACEWDVHKLEYKTDPGKNAPKESTGRTVWTCVS